MKSAATKDLTSCADLARAIGQLGGHTEYLHEFLHRLASAARSTDLAAIELPCSVAELAATIAGVVDILNSISPVARRLDVALMARTPTATPTDR